MGGGVSGGGAASRLQYSGLLNERFALGVSAQKGEFQRELVGHGVFLNETKDLEFDVALSFMKGLPSFEFVSGTERLAVTQFSGVASMRRLYAPENGVGLHSVGGSVWGAQSKSPNNLTPKNVFEDTDQYWNLIVDSRRISTGKMRGGSTDFQYAATASLVFNSSIGMEEVVYPMSNGTRERHRRPYLSAGAKWQVGSDSMLFLRTSTGISREINLSYSGGIGNLSVGISKGRDGSLSNKSVMFYVDLISVFSQKKVEYDSATLALKESLQNYSKSALLDKVSMRPMQLPQTFLAKVDKTAVRQIYIEKSGLPPGSVFSDDKKELMIPVGTGPLLLVSSKVNGNEFLSDQAFVLSVGLITLKLGALASPQGAGDQYVLRVTDGVGATYDVKLTVRSVMRS